MIERAKRLNFAACAPAYIISDEVLDMEQLNIQYSNFFKESYNVNVQLGTEVTEIDPVSKMVKLRANGAEHRIGYDAMIFALGADSLLPPQAPSNCKNLVMFRTLDDVATIRKYLNLWSRSGNLHKTIRDFPVYEPSLSYYRSQRPLNKGIYHQVRRGLRMRYRKRHYSRKLLKARADKSSDQSCRTLLSVE